MAEIIGQRSLGPANTLQGSFDAWRQVGYPIEGKAGVHVGRI